MTRPKDTSMPVRDRQIEREDYDARITRVEAVIEGLANSVTNLEHSIERFVSSQRTNWGTIFSGLSVVAIVVFAMNQATIRPMEVENVNKSSLIRQNSERLDAGVQRDADMLALISNIRADRFTSEDGVRHDIRLAALEAQQAQNSTAIEWIKRELEVLRPLVYKEE